MIGKHPSNRELASAIQILEWMVRVEEKEGGVGAGWDEGREQSNEERANREKCNFLLLYSTYSAWLNSLKPER